jgi:hypothetical protein
LRPQTIADRPDPATDASFLLGEFFSVRINRVVGALFIAAMLSFMGAILCLLREVLIATTSSRIGLHRRR